MAEGNRYVFAEDISTLFWFPHDPQFGQWIMKKSTTQYDIYEGRYSDEPIENVLVNWSPVRNVFGFQIVKSPHDPVSFHHSPVFTSLKERIGTIKMKGGFLMIDDPQDVVMFKLLYGELLPAHQT